MRQSLAYNVNLVIEPIFKRKDISLIIQISGELFIRQKTLDFKLKAKILKITGVPFFKFWRFLMNNKKNMDIGVVFYRKPQSKYGCFVFICLLFDSY